MFGCIRALLSPQSPLQYRCRSIINNYTVVTPITVTIITYPLFLPLLLKQLGTNTAPTSTHHISTTVTMSIHIPILMCLS